MAESQPSYCFLGFDHWATCLGASEWASWVQAIGSILAILGAVCLTRMQVRAAGELARLQIEAAAEQTRLQIEAAAEQTRQQLQAAADAERLRVLAAHRSFAMLLIELFGLGAELQMHLQNDGLARQFFQGRYRPETQRLRDRLDAMLAEMLMDQTVSFHGERIRYFYEDVCSKLALVDALDVGHTLFTVRSRDLSQSVDALMRERNLLAAFIDRTMA